MILGKISYTRLAQNLSCLSKQVWCKSLGQDCVTRESTILLLQQLLYHIFACQLTNLNLIKSVLAIFSTSVKCITDSNYLKRTKPTINKISLGERGAADEVRRTLSRGVLNKKLWCIELFVVEVK